MQAVNVHEATMGGIAYLNLPAAAAKATGVSTVCSLSLRSSSSVFLQPIQARNAAFQQDSSMVGCCS